MTVATARRIVQAMCVAAVFMVCALLATCWMPARAQTIPSAARAYERELTRVVQQEWGLDGSVAVHAAQLHQESAWRPGVSSAAGAQGLAQFMPATAAWMAQAYPDLGPAAPYSPGWAMRAQARYNRFNWQRIPGAADICQHWAMTLSAYNGGLGWVQRDRAAARAAGADPAIWFGSVENHTARAGWAERENRQYVARILLALEPIYREAGWPGAPIC